MGSAVEVTRLEHTALELHHHASESVGRRFAGSWCWRRWWKGGVVARPRC